ncbi:Htaa protein [Corynebacterium kutscheri]|uniref:Htaa protein n=1 Tax=Corynebacterium kutscheri TaxID=35755 RepID=A0A0F6QZR8_9CORY|nr:HtaA domain-containing protein [Corynebacterium kutscheri]AKE40850.1 Htaa protein [Corynebacterium kutscheri]VEH09147.1 Cell-surface hemin receptor [Corynebacterium kutscheri]
MNTQRFRHLLTTTVACTTLLSVTATQAIAQDVPASHNTAASVVEEKETEPTQLGAEDTSDADAPVAKAPEAENSDTKDTKSENDAAAKATDAVEPGKSPDSATSKTNKPNPESKENTNESALTWGIRTSFNNYTKGPTEMIGSATQNDEKNKFTFKLDSTTYDSATEKFEAKFNGGVHYKKYCDNGTSGTCSLDLKIENPRIVISKDGSFVYAKVSSKKYSGGGTYTNEGTDDAKPIAKLYTASATFEEEGNKVTWKEIPTTLTADGDEMFSHFYGVGVGIDPITFTFDKSHLTDFKRPSTDNAKYAVASQLFDNDGLYEHHREVFKIQDHLIVATADHRWNPVEKAGFALLDRDLKETHSAHIKLNEYGAVTFDEKNSDLYFLQKQEPGNGKKTPANDDPRKIYKVHVDLKTGFKDPELIHTFGDGDEVNAISYNPHSGDVVAISQKQVAVVNTGSTIKPIDLPESTELIKGTDFDSASNVYGAARYSNNNDDRELLPMKDGTFIFNSDGKLSKEKTKEEKDKEKNEDYPDPKKHYYGVMVSINPKNTEAPAKLLPESAFEDSNFSSTTARSNGTTVLRFTQNTSKDYSYAQSFTYAEQKITLKSEDIVKADKSDVKTWGNALVSDNDKIMALDAHDGMLKTVDAKTFKTTDNDDSTVIPNGSKTSANQHGPILQLDEGTFYVPSYDASAGESKEKYVLRKVYDPKFVPKVEEKSDRPEPDDKDRQTEKPVPPTSPKNPTPPTSSKTPAPSTTSKQPVPPTSSKKPDNNPDPKVPDISSKQNIWTIVFGVLGTLGVLGTILGLVHTFAGPHIQKFLEQFRR